MRFDLQHLRRAIPGWLLALVLWLPVAQWAAAVHLLEHLHDATTAVDAEPKGLTACDTCVVAAALHATAPVPRVAPPALPVLAQARPGTLATAQVAAAPALPYRSRAPPLPHA